MDDWEELKHDYDNEDISRTLYSTEANPSRRFSWLEASVAINISISCLTENMVLKASLCSNLKEIVREYFSNEVLLSGYLLTMIAALLWSVGAAIHGQVSA